IRSTQNVFEILKELKNYIVRTGIENSYRKYSIVVFDVDGRGATYIGTKNKSTYVRTPKGNHFYALVEKKILNTNTKLKIEVGVKRKKVNVDFIVNTYVLGVVGIFETDLEAINWFIQKYQATITDKTAQNRIEKLNNQFELHAQIEQVSKQPLN
ncbi:20443_t:CDS:2, partial [Funneliformis geosporum]